MKKIKVLAMYLPQFHRIPENDKWWGEGFTDWVSTKKAKPLFDGHYQPHIPLGENYYNLLEKETMEHQAELMHKYGVDGICVYHYWFENGKRVLEKPIENLLKWKDIDMPFCFCWANETWARSWSQISGANAWADILEDREKKQENDILLRQIYGREKEWEEHFEYFLPFFKDDRYIKIEGRPVLVLYKASDITCLCQMLRYWKRRAIEEGFGGLHIISSNVYQKVSKEVDALLLQEPQRSFSIVDSEEKEEVSQYFDYSKICEAIEKNNRFDRKTYFCGVCGFDDTPRRGKNGKVIGNVSPQKFEECLSVLMAKSELEGNEFLFINAWNEWGEGMHLEPDSHYGYSFLQAIKSAKEKYSSINIDSTEKSNELYDNKFEKYMNCLDKWMDNWEKGSSICSYLEKHNYRKIAIYGYGMLGKHLELEIHSTDSNIEVVCVIDKEKKGNTLFTSISKMEDELPEFDVLVVTPFYYFEDILEEVGNVEYDIISIEQIIYEI